MKLLITGASGFVGGHLVEFLRREQPAGGALGHRAASRGSGGRAFRRPRAWSRPTSTTRWRSTAALADLAPDAHRPPGRPVEPPAVAGCDPGGTLRTNVLGIVHLLEAARRLGLRPRVLVVGSAEEYGGRRPRRRCRSPRTTPLRPSSPYAVSKVAQGLLARRVRHAGRHARGPHPHLPPHGPRPRRGLRGELVRPPDRRDRGGPAAARHPRGQPRSGARLHRRARRGARLLGAPGEGAGRRGLQRLQRAGDAASASFSTSCSRLARVEVEVRVDPDRLRPSDVPVLVGDPGAAPGGHGLDAVDPHREDARGPVADWRRRVAAAAAVAPGRP